MRRSVRLAIAGMWVIAAPPVLAQTVPGPPTIIVQGRGEAERAPDAFFIGGRLRGEAVDQVGALQALADAQTRLADGLTRLEGLTAAKLRTEGVTVQPIYDPACGAERDNRDRVGCRTTGYAASLRFQFKGAPARLAGDAVSLAAERRAGDVATTGVDIDDDHVLRAEANRLAFADARAQADALAEASGRRIVRILRVQDAYARDPDFDAGEADDVVVTGTRIRPTVAIPVDQPPVRVLARINVVFEIE